MKSLDTYNRASSLAAGQHTVWLGMAYWLLMIAAMAIAVINHRHWQIDTYYLLPVGLFFIALLVVLYRQRLSRHCRFCGGKLATISRDFNLRVEHLNSQGLKGEQCFYLQKPSGLLRRPRWVKLYNQSKACHTCRIFEDGYKQVEEAVTAGEVEALSRRYQERYGA